MSLSKLVIRNEGAFYYHHSNFKPDDVVIKSGGLTEELIHRLSPLYSGITKLTLAFGSRKYDPSPLWSTVPSLFAHFATSLTTVKLYGKIDDTKVEPLAQTLASLSALTSLTLVGDYPTDRLSLFGPVLSRLQKFACSSYSRAWVSHVSSLSPRCTHLLLDQDVFTTFSGPFLTQLSTSLTHLHLQFCASTTIWQSLSQMHALTGLTLSLKFATLDSSLFTNLAPFSRLTQVKLFPLFFLTPLALPSKKETPLSGIKRLTLGFCSFSSVPHFDIQLFCETVSVWFPSLLHFTLIIEGGNIPAMRARLGQLPFAVEILDYNSVDILSTDW